MFLYKFTIIFVTGLIISTKTHDFEGLTYHLDVNLQPFNKADLYLMEDMVTLNEKRIEKVDIKLYYECLCPGCRNFDTAELAPTVKKLSDYLDVHLYPYGNAKTIIDDDGTIEFKCQHGPEECYGNMLHACAIYQLGNTKAVIYNSCMMEFSQPSSGSNDEAADNCGNDLNINAEPIKQCAKGANGTELLKYYGQESKKAGFSYVPYVLVNGDVYTGDDFMKYVCAAFAAPPPPCSE